MRDVKDYILNEFESLKRNLNSARPEWIAYRSGMLYEILIFTNIKLDNRNEIENFLLKTSLEYSKKIKQIV